MSKSIVIAIDTEERSLDALALGRLLTESTALPAKLVTVSPREEAADRLSALGSEMGLESASVEVVASDAAARELQHVTERADTGLIVVGSTTRGRIGRLLIGSTGERLLAGAASPVAIAPHGYHDAPAHQLTRVGVGVDDSDEAQHALETAAALARKAGATIRVITAYKPLAFGGVATTGALPGPSVNEVMRADLSRIHESAVATARESVEADGRFRDGSAEDVLLEESADLDLLVVGSRGYGPIGAVLMGSATTALVHGAACPILVTPRGTRFDLLDE